MCPVLLDGSRKLRTENHDSTHPACPAVKQTCEREHLRATGRPSATCSAAASSTEAGLRWGWGLSGWEAGALQGRDQAFAPMLEKARERQRDL